MSPTCLTGPPRPSNATIHPLADQERRQEDCASQRHYVWPHTLNVYARKVIEASGGEVIFEEYYPLDQIDFSSTVNPRHLQQGRRGLQHRIPPASSVLQATLRSGFHEKRGTALLWSTTTRTRSASISRLKSKDCQLPGLFQGAGSGRSRQRQNSGEFDKQFPGTFLFAAGSAATGTYSRTQLWERRSRKRASLIATLLPPRSIMRKSLKVRRPAEMVPDSALQDEDVNRRCKGGNYEIVAQCGLVDPRNAEKSPGGRDSFP